MSVSKASTLKTIRYEYALGTRDLAVLKSVDRPDAGQVCLTLNEKSIWVGSELAVEMALIILEHFGEEYEAKQATVQDSPRLPFVSPGKS